jgi:hypothetical protein
VWRRVQSGIRPLALPPVDGGFCIARL